MKVIVNKFALLICLLLPAAPVYAWQWSDLWRTPDQQGATLLKQGKSKEAAQAFKNPEWQAVAQYRSGDYAKAFQQFSSKKTSDDQYNAGNSAAFQGQYKEAIAAYDKAIALNSDNTDAVNNRDIVKKLQAKQQQEQKNNPDDKKSKEDKNQQASSQQKSSSQDNKDQAKKDQNQTSPQNASAKNKDENEQSKDGKQSAQNEKQQKDQQAQADQEKKLENQTNDNKKSNGKLDNTNPMNEALADNQMQNQDEAKKQLLRRLADDPGGLLRQKFIRDYYRRHPASEYLQPGDDN